MEHSDHNQYGLKQLSRQASTLQSIKKGSPLSLSDQKMAKKIPFKYKSLAESQTYGLS
jgi:hypothetical protein